MTSLLFDNFGIIIIIIIIIIIDAVVVAVVVIDFNGRAVDVIFAAADFLLFFSYLS